MTAAFVIAIGLFGLLIGSFLNVVIARVPAGESVVTPRSRCPQCQHEISAAENVPVVSYVALKARCSNCRTRISVRYPAVEVLTGLLFALMAYHFGASWVLPAWLYLSAIGIALAAIDLDTQRLPDVLTLPSYLVGAGLLLLPTVIEGTWDAMLRAILGAAALYAFYFALAFIHPGGMGFGDVKLSGVLGLYLGYLGWGTLMVGGFLGFVLGAVIGVALMAVGTAGRKQRIPFGPFMLAGALLAVFIAPVVTDWYLGLI